MSAGGEAGARAFSRDVADAFMATFPHGMRLSSGYNGLVQMLSGGLALSNYSPSLFSRLQVLGGAQRHGTVAFTMRGAMRERFCGIDMGMQAERFPDINALMGYRNTAVFEFVQHMVTMDELPQGYSMWTEPGEAQQGDFEQAGSRNVVVPMMNGSFNFLSDSDGQDGLFVRQGDEHFYSRTFEDVPNRIVPSVSEHGAVSVLLVSQRLEELVRVPERRKLMMHTSSVRNTWMFIRPEHGVTMRAYVETSARRREFRMVPMGVFLDSLLYHHGGGRRVRVADVEALFADMEHICEDVTPPALLDPSECDRFRMIVANAKHMTIAGMPRGGSPPPIDVLQGQPLWIELLPHIADRGLGSLDDGEGVTRLGCLRRMLAVGLACLFGHGRQVRMDPRSMRVRTAEMEAFVSTRSALMSAIQPKEREKVRRYDVEMRNVLEGKHEITATIDRALQNESDIRRSYPNLVEHLNTIKYTHDNTDNDTDPSRRRYPPGFTGTVCQADTPCTTRVGKDLNPNSCTIISSPVDPILLCGVLRPHMAPPGRRPVPVFVNGIHVASAADADETVGLVRRLRARVIERRREGHKHMYCYRPFLMIGVDVKEELLHRDGRFQLVPSVHIRCDPGRLVKPVYVLASPLLQRREALGFWELVDGGAIEFIDVDEECSDRVRLVAELWAAGPEHTHADLHPSLLQGTLAGLVPHAKNNHGVKVTNMCNHFKAVMHRFSLQYARRFQAPSSAPRSCVTYVGFNNQQPMVRPPGYDWHEMQHRPHGYNVVIGIMTAGGANQEDAVVMRRSLRDRGFGFGICERTFALECNHNDEVQLLKPVGSTFGPNDTLVENTTVRAQNVREQRREHAMSAGLQESGVVTDIRRVGYSGTTSGKVKFIVNTHEPCVPQLGDKFASPHAQKGVIGRIIDDMDMPFTRDGLRVDVLLNPQAIPSRMTVAQLIEIVHGSHAAAYGRRRREFAYDETPVEQVAQELAQALGVDGMQDAGLQTMHDPYTGEPYPAKVFTGVCYYSRLKHMVNEKVRANDILGGEKNMMTRQGCSGRKFNGGLKVAEMERWSIVGNGASHMVREMYRKLADGADLQVERLVQPGAAPKANSLRSNPLNASASCSIIEGNYSTASVIQRLESAMLTLDIETAPRSAEAELGPA